MRSVGGYVCYFRKHFVINNLTCAYVNAGSISQTLTYPFDVLRRKMQVTGMKSDALGIRYTGALDALVGIVRTEGARGLYRGLWPNLRKWDLRDHLNFADDLCC